MVDITISHIESCVTHVLSIAFGQPFRLDFAGYVRDRLDICRFNVLDGPSTAPSSVIVKVIATSASHPPAPNDRIRLRRLFYNEWLGLTLLEQVVIDPPLTPRFYGSENATGMLVMEDLGTPPTLWETLQRSDSQSATTQLVALATALGRMHAHTIGEQPRFEQLRGMLAPDHLLTDLDVYDWLRPTLEATTATLDLPVLPAVIDDLDLLKQRLTAPAPFHAYTQGDPSPGNCLFVAPSMRLLDFGTGTYRHAFVDFPPPWCWQKIPLSVMDLMIEAYQIALREGYAAADPTAFAHGLVEGCAYWSMTLLKDWSLAEVAANVSMRRSLLQILESFGAVSQQKAHLEALGATIMTIVETIRRRWPIDTSQPDYYPAFHEC